MSRGMDPEWCVSCSELSRVEYVGLNGRAGSGEWECMNKDCTPKEEKPTGDGELRSGDDGTWQWDYRFQLAGGMLDGSVTPEDYAWGADYIDGLSFPPHALMTPSGKYFAFTPTRSAQAQTAQASQASGATAQTPHRQGYQGLSSAYQAALPPRKLRALDLDDPDQCTLQQQAGHLPQRSDMPTTQSDDGIEIRLRMWATVLPGWGYRYIPDPA